MIARQVKGSLILNRENLETENRKRGLSSVKKGRSLMFGMVLDIFSFNEKKVVQLYGIFPTTLEAKNGSK